MTEYEKMCQDLVTYGTAYTIGGKHIPLEDVMIDMVSYDQAIMAGAEYIAEEQYGRVKVTADLLAKLFNKNNGEVYLDLKAERKEQKKVM